MSTFIHTSHRLTESEKSQIKQLIDNDSLDEAENMLHNLRDDRVICLRACGWKLLFNKSKDYDDFESFKEWFMQDDIELHLYEWEGGECRKVSKKEFLDEMYRPPADDEVKCSRLLHNCA